MDGQGKKIVEAVMTVMIVTIFVVIASLITGTVLGDIVFDNVIVTGSIFNESLGAVANVSNVTFGIITTYPLTTCSLLSVSNATGGELLGASNYTFTPVGCRLILTDISSYLGALLNSSYTYSADTNVSILGINTVDISTQFGLFVAGLIAFLALIGTIVGIIWLVSYVRALFNKKEGLQGITA